MPIDFSSLDNFFSLNQAQKDQILFNWGQSNLVSLHGKTLEKACADLAMYFRQHPEQQLCPNLVVSELYWGPKPHQISHNQLNYCMKDMIMNILVYKHCEYIHFDEKGWIVVNPEVKTLRFIYKDAEDKKSHPNKVIKESTFTLKQKDTIWNGIAVGYLDVKEIEEPVKKTKQSKSAEEDISLESIHEENEPSASAKKSSKPKKATTKKTK